jgi:DNA-binding transcriptional MerR regulator/ribosomal protein S18 acetylase RimI-like enzyme
MKELGPAEFSAATGLSVKALRLYDERGLLVPARVDRTTGYRRYTEDQIATAGRIALLRRAGISLADIARFLPAPTGVVIERWLADLAAETGARRRALDALASALGFGASIPKEPAMAVIIRPVDSPAELVTAFDVAGAQTDPAVDHTDRRFADLEAAYPGERELLLVAEETGSVVGAAMGFTSPWPEVTMRILAVAPDRRGQGIGRALLRAFEASALRLGATRISLGADAEAGFYIRHGYQTMLLLQWAYDPGNFDAEVEALAAGPLKEMTRHRESFGGVPQLFVDLDEPSPVVRAQVQDLISGAHVGYCMTKAINTQNEPATSGPGCTEEVSR